jgi:hypothetical protein
MPSRPRPCAERFSTFLYFDLPLFRTRAMMARTAGTYKLKVMLEVPGFPAAYGKYSCVGTSDDIYRAFYTSR